MFYNCVLVDLGVCHSGGADFLIFRFFENFQKFSKISKISKFSFLAISVKMSSQTSHMWNSWKHTNTCKFTHVNLRSRVPRQHFHSQITSFTFCHRSSTPVNTRVWQTLYPYYVMWKILNAKILKHKFFKNENF